MTTRPASWTAGHIAPWLLNPTDFVLVASPFAVIWILVGRLAAYTRDRMNR